MTTDTPAAEPIESTDPEPTPAHTPPHATPEATEEAGDAATTDADSNEHAGATEGDRRDPAAQAARYRRRLREVEAERDTLATERDTARGALLRDLMVRESNLAPSALDEPDVIPPWDAVLDESGHLSPDLIRAHLGELGRTRPHLFHRPVDPIQGRTRGGNTGHHPSWSDVLNGTGSPA